MKKGLRIMGDGVEGLSRKGQRVLSLAKKTQTVRYFNILKSAIKKETDTCSFHGLLLYHFNCTIGKFILPPCRSVRL